MIQRRPVKRRGEGRRREEIGGWIESLTSGPMCVCGVEGKGG